MKGKLSIKWFYPSSLRTADIDIYENEGVAPQVVHLLANDDSFGEFLFDRLLIHIEDYSKYNAREENYISPTLVSNNTGTLSASTGITSVYDDCGGWYNIENAWESELNKKVDICDFNHISETVSKLCESATLTAPMNNNHTKKENNIMKFNFDFGPVNPSMVRMSLYGLAVKNKAGTWVSYDAKAGDIMDVDILNFDGAKFLYRMPVAIKDIAIGDVIVHNGVPMFVIAIATNGTYITGVDPVNGERKDIMLPRSPFGFNFATKVVNFLGNMMIGATAENPFGNMWMLMAMSGDNKDMSDILPLMMLSGANGGTMDSNMLMFMALSGDNKDMLPWLMMSQSMNATPAHTCACGGNCGKNPEQN